MRWLQTVVTKLSFIWGRECNTFALTGIRTTANNHYREYSRDLQEFFKECYFNANAVNRWIRRVKNKISD